MAIQVIVRGDEEIARRFANTPARVAMLTRALEAHLALLQGAVVPLTPVGVTSNLRGSWQSAPPIVGAMGLEGHMGSALIYADVIERGRRPGATMPPPDALATWVARKMGSGVSPYVVARAIGRKGIQGRHMLERAVMATRSAAAAIWASTVRNLVSGS